MPPFTEHTGVAAALLRPNIDTDAIIPSREMTSVGKTGLADGLFAVWRYLDAAARVPDPQFVLNRPAQRGSSVLLGGENFGCGSSREHAVWALKEYGVRAVVAPSFGAIFAANCVRNGLAPVLLPAAQVQALAEVVAADPKYHQLTVDLLHQRLSVVDGPQFRFSMPDEQRQALVSGLDPIGQTLQLGERIAAFEARDRALRPWAYLA
ncbi:3-isopropylmalate dehydratase small subunit [Aquabacterium sp. OR-4]|uniref:3-isopropylmalate dehydratase small subunit n=1 Tax=Aquabacterium sp. OR-4 TaxID=2978127 RepID=UPI0021B3FFA2|nr:3-isopropylmalate dehydratase small subunit [Aquabacterium sp. OR-4]MDT7836929.1 3-isopropylmalate dehydratase small subunit [Aquabacterium sp. OR-4]